VQSANGVMGVSRPWELENAPDWTTSLPTGEGVAVQLAGDAADFMTGGHGRDYLNGEGGADTMIGGRGDDIYVVDNPLDVVIELRGQGNDSVRTALATYSLTGDPALAEIEDVVATGNGFQSLSGNDLSNVLIANPVGSTLNGRAGDDVLISQGGADVLTGGPGSDLFRFVGVASEPVRITDFDPATDILDLRFLLSAYHGSDPVADAWLAFPHDPMTGVRVFLDPDGPLGPAGYRAIMDLTGLDAAPPHYLF
jgi:Ca2+-binding RTX toxin-like protein